ncbi:MULTISPECIES: Rpp14/Pop5 family protein [Halobacterium]|uniref:Ribonuclease P protein component 2 n=6 Tax=Halobacterium salinarum TaxID=2242 RepID=RNP2_HALSA|nr:MULTISPECIES: Rpp14/Pop5 family protein [Halobacterium]B0R594.1 RecName: Full=Ribonuclease P protein component 2; Short=RNase P component 2; AltName: Full=Pop5 [Halobacterium salinarum R1]Q9HQ86.1 RecName: Full=Ribonuclease P protein component 2; Short=RNase P component 2; AltName: Full=Pop5 [Halobacterium salinarum NRC-1]AAG19630.1 hypothetical protein VNG_1279H [Halobacterium salinarum NRC-1]MBB6090320.1 ribonuclease P/MRP protein subunit POP5 [Halobacterium salinarum]MCF2165139.1 ribonuc
MKHLPKHVRPRWRYLAVGIEAWPDAGIERSDFQRALWFAAGNLLGDPGSADAGVRVVAYSFRDGRGEALVRARRGTVSRARAAVACVSAVREHPVRVCVRGVSGTMRAARERYLDGLDTPERRSDVAFDGDARDGVCRGENVDVVAGDDGWVGARRRDCGTDGE